MKTLFQLTIVMIVLLISLPGFSADSYRVVFETLDCNGSAGFAIIGPEQIYKIEDGDCSHPNNPKQRLKNMLIHDGSGSYKVFTLSQDEARKVINDVRDYMAAKKKALEGADSVIITQ